MTPTRRPTDLLARYGGEAFAVILPGTSLHGAMQIAQDVLAAVEALEMPHDGSPFGHVTISIGAAWVMATGDQSLGACRT